MWVIVYELEILELEAEDILDLRIDLHLRERTRLTRQLQLHLFYMVAVDVRVAKSVYKLTRLESCHLRYHHEKKGIRSDVEGYSKEGVGTALVELQAELAIGHVELEEGMARR